MCTHISIYVYCTCVYIFSVLYVYIYSINEIYNFLCKGLENTSPCKFLYFHCLFVLCIKLYIPSNVHPIMQQLCISSKQISHKNWECAYFSFPLFHSLPHSHWLKTYVMRGSVVCCVLGWRSGLACVGWMTDIQSVLTLISHTGL